LRRHVISLARRGSWCISTDPCFAQKAANIVGLYLQPPEKAVVLSVDEKPDIQAPERAQGWLKLSNGKALMGFSHEYKRHGTTTLFAALDVATGLPWQVRDQIDAFIDRYGEFNVVRIGYSLMHYFLPLWAIIDHRPKCSQAFSGARSPRSKCPRAAFFSPAHGSC
jgi:hypothetical protein